MTECLWRTDKENTRGLWSPSIALAVHAGRGVLAVLVTGNKNELRKKGKGISPSSRKLWLKCVMTGHLARFTGTDSMLQSLKGT